MPDQADDARIKKLELGHLMALPAELHLAIIAHLDVVSLAYLALSCPTLYACYFPNHLDLAPEAKLGFLEKLERDTPSVYLCHFCIKLHAWSDSSKFDDFWEPRLCKGDYGFADIRYYHARLLMNKYLFGPSHGPSLETLSWKFSPKLHELSVCHEKQARIVDGKLLLLRTQKIAQLVPTSVTFKQYMERDSVKICQHISTSTLNDFTPRIPQLADTGRASAPFKPCVDSQGSCARCMTDYTISIQYNPLWSVRVDTYQAFGQARSPWEWDWRVMADLSPDDLPRDLHPAGYCAGIIRHWWSKQDGVVHAPGGIFVHSRMSRWYWHEELRQQAAARPDRMLLAPAFRNVEEGKGCLFVGKTLP